MSTPAGHIELDRTVDSIIVGTRHRTDLGDLAALAASIEREGLLQPLTVTLDGVLVCGARRLAAIKLLGWKTVNVWVRSGISGRLGHLLAEQDDNLLHKDLTPVEAAALYRELKALLAEDAARNEAATRFSAERQPGTDGVANLATPSISPVGDSRRQAAAMIPGGAGHTTLEKIDYIRRIAEDPTTPPELREQALGELEQIDAGGSVHPAYERIRTTTSNDDDDDLRSLAAEALARAHASSTGDAKQPADPAAAVDAEPERWPVRAFVATWSELADWWTHYDADRLAGELSDEQAITFLSTAEGTSRFADELRTARDRLEGGVTRGHLRAL
ncbi:ParB N-terminal domain-containing protein [Brevibacterium casei]|uniref:ParB N-terminal domain-containing protein n=1 Tax=Brevibacterium casei TaxID=33889 RepID=UPI003F815391